VSRPDKPVWVAGFSQNRAATKVHDDLLAVACVVDDGQTRLGIAVIDAIGFFHDDVLQVRRRLERSWNIDYAIVCSTHNHTTPDLMGLWGKNPLHTGVDPEYREQVINGIVQSFAQAVTNLQTSTMTMHEIPTAPEGLVADTRKPLVFDADLRVLHFRNAETKETIGSIVNWGNHPETPWSHNTEITSDFCGYLREALAKGVRIEGKTALSGLGGVHLFVNGAVGGLMTTHPSVTVTNPFTQVAYKEPSHAKAEAVGLQLASRILPVLQQTPAPDLKPVPIGIRARTLNLPVANKGFLAATVLGLLNRGHSKWMHMRTEVAVVTLGDASIACVPGEIYPEIVNGGVERAPGGDFDINPVEVPSIRELMPGKVRFVFGLANDEIGYIIPKSEWDEKPPYLYGASHGVYGEENSVGPETAPLLHQALKELCQPLSQARSTRSDK
jgi:hypothetical protein